MFFITILILVGSAFCKEYDEFSLLEDFKENAMLGRDLEVIIIVKDYTQSKRTKLVMDRHLRRKENETHEGPDTTGVIGRTSIRELEKGVIFGFSLENDNVLLENSKWKKFFVSPSGVDFFDHRMLISGGSSIEEIDLKSGESKRFTNDWFRHLHTVEYNHNGDKCLITSTGFDMVIEYDLINENIVWEWNAWEHGFNKSEFGDYLITRDPKVREEFSGEDIVFVDPSLPEFGGNGVAGAFRAVHVNGAFYYGSEKEKKDSDDDESMLIGMTFAHKNLTLLVSKVSGDYRVVYDNLYFPHGFHFQNRPNPCKGYIVSDTNSAEIVFLDENFEPCCRVSVHGLPSDFLEIADPVDILWEIYDEEEDKEYLEGQKKQRWLQYTSHIKDDIYSVVDTTSRHFIIVDMAKKEYRILGYEHDMSVQMVIPEPPYLSEYFIEYFKNELKEKRMRYLGECKEGSGQTKKKDLILRGKERKKELLRVSKMKRLYIAPHEMRHFQDFCEGKYEPFLGGFMNEDEFHCVLEEKSLCDGSKFWGEDVEREVIVKSLWGEDKGKIEVGDEVVIFTERRKKNQKGKGEKKKSVGVMKVESIFKNDKFFYAAMMYGKTVSFKGNYLGFGKKPLEHFHNHEGVKKIMAGTSEWLVGGRIISCL